MKPQPVIVLGAGGNCRDIVDSMNDINRVAGETVFEPLGYLDDDPAKEGMVLGGVRVLGPLSAIAEYPHASVVDGLNGTSLTSRKHQILGSLGLPRARYVTIVHPTASVSQLATVGAGTVILQNVTINSDARIGDHVMVLPNSVVSHDAVVDDYCYLTPGVVLAGYVHLEQGVYIGARSAVMHRVTIGTGAVVGMGSVVLEDVAAGTTVVGVPAHPIG